MESLLDHFPVFAANQVLTSGHLNDVFNYLDQQERLARSHLIGIGIVCGLEIKLSGSAIMLSKGCGVTSMGYLIVEPVDISLVAYRDYTLPPDIDYPPFKDGKTKNQPFALLELFEGGVPNTTPLSSLDLSNMAVLLFLELKKDSLRNCSPNICDDKGSQVTASVRRLLIAKQDLDAIIAAANGLGTGLTASDLDDALSARLNLPDLRLARFDVVNSNPVTSNDVYTAFLNRVRGGGLAKATGDALAAAYLAFQPLLVANFPTNPFANFNATYGFLDSAPTNVVQVKFLQYYADLFDELLRAYDEFRWKGLELLCACCPDDGLFPRHLMLGLLHPETATPPENYRQGYLPSPAIADCSGKTQETVQLFARLVEMATSFTDAPTLPKPAQSSASVPVDSRIRVTPSTLGGCGVDLADKAIPYYYAQTGTPPLYRLWSPTKTRRNRAHHNFSYNADLYADPSAPAFVTDPLRYELEPYNFLRIEGHLGKDYQNVLRSLLSLKSQYRLPIDCIALRTGAYDESQAVNLTQETARFQDLEALYEALRGELMSELAEGIMQLYDKTIPAVTGLTLNAGTPKLPLLSQYAPHYSYAANTVGAWYEYYLTRFESQGYIDVNQNAINPSAVLTVYCVLFNGTNPLDSSAYPNVVAIYYISRLAEIVANTLAGLSYADFENKYQDLMGLIRYFRSDAITVVTPDLKNFLPEEEFIDFCEGVLFGCKLDAIKVVYDEYITRIGNLKKLQFLSSFLQQHPGIQHKAGVPMGGTFIIIYHGDPGPSGLVGNVGFNLGLLQQQLQLTGQAASVNQSFIQPAPAMVAKDILLAQATVAAASTDPSALIKAISNISANRNLIADNNVSLVIGMLTGQTPISGIGGIWPPINIDPAANIIASAVDSLANGTVIADFFLPYLVSCDCPGIQYVLPKVPPTFTIAVDCTAADGNAVVTISAKGGVPPYDAAVDGKPYQALSGPLQLAVGDHSIILRDTDGTETPAQAITVVSPIVIGTPAYTCAGGNYTATASISGGVPPYEVNGKAAPNGIIATDPTASGTTVSVTVTDARGCTATAPFNHICPPPCTLPCAGIALNYGYRFFIPDADPNPNNAYKSFKLNSATFIVDSAPGKSVDLSADVTKILQATPDQLQAANFPKLVSGWVQAINKLIAGHAELNQVGKGQWLTLSYNATTPGRLGVLMIEYFQCLSFNIRISVSYVQGANQQTLAVAYSPSSTSIQRGDFTITIPAFNGTTTDKCSATPTPVNLCPVPPGFSLQVQKVGGGTGTPLDGQTAFTVSASVSPSSLSFLWEVQDGTPAIANGQGLTTSFTSPGNKLVTVTAFDAKGCSASASLSIQVG